MSNYPNPGSNIPNQQQQHQMMLQQQQMMMRQQPQPHQQHQNMQGMNYGQPGMNPMHISNSGHYPNPPSAISASSSFSAAHSVQPRSPMVNIPSVPPSSVPPSSVPPSSVPPSSVPPSSVPPSYGPASQGPMSVNPSTPMNPASQPPPATPLSNAPLSQPSSQSVSRPPVDVPNSFRDPVELSKSLILNDLRHKFAEMNAEAAKILKAHNSGDFVTSESYMNSYVDFMSVCDEIEQSLTVVMETSKQLSKLEKVYDQQKDANVGPISTYVDGTVALMTHMEKTVGDVYAVIGRMRRRENLAHPDHS